MPHRNQRLGSIGERLAADFLESEGYKILTRNFRYSRNAEVDIIAKVEDIIVFVEVKTRYDDDKGRPAEAVNLNKQRKIILAATKYLQENDLFDRVCRFDVIEVFANKDMEFSGWEINHIESAFEVTEDYPRFED